MRIMKLKTLHSIKPDQPFLIPHMNILETPGDLNKCRLVLFNIGDPEDIKIHDRKIVKMKFNLTMKYISLNN